MVERNFKAPERTETGSDSLVWKILEFLRERRFEPGERLPGERYLAERFGVGRNTLREAFAALIALRVLETRPHSGVYLRKNASESSFETLVLLAELGAPPSRQEILDSIEVRLALELLAVRLACERREPEDLRKMTDIVEATDRLLAENGNIYELDQAFHMALAASTHNIVLVRILHAFYRLSLGRRQQIFQDLAKGRHSALTHRELTSAIAAGDAARAGELMREHLTTAHGYWEDGPSDAGSAGDRRDRFAI